MSAENQPSGPAPLPPFAYAAESAAFETRWLQEIIKRYHSKITQVIPTENIHKFAHGAGWSFQNDQGGEGAGQFQAHSVGHMMEGSERLDCDMGAMGRHVDAIVDKFMAGMRQSLFQTLDTTTQQTGNVVKWSQSAQDAPAAFLEMIQKVDFGVDEDGKPTLPSFLEISAEFRNALEQHSSTHPEYRAEVERIKAAKQQAAFEREAARKAKFKRPA